MTYELKNKTLDYFPSSILDQSEVTPVYEKIQGWKDPTSGVRHLSELPKAAINYIQHLEELLQIPIVLISTGPERDDTIVIKDPFDN